VHDLAFERFPDAYNSGQRRYLRLTTRWAERVCPELLAVSGSTRNDLVQLHRVDPARVTVVYPGGGELPVSTAGAADEELRRLGIDEPFALQVGRVEQRKNPLAALGAVERLPALLLVVAGQVVDDGLAQRLRASPRCRVLGRVQPKVRELLYRRAAALIHPSLYEGFGFPVLEAMRSGLPVVTVRTSSLPEVAGEAALYVDDPTDVPALAEQLRRLLGDSELREKLVEAGRRRAAQFTWDSCARGVLEVIRRRLAAPPAR
jgi:glycosyltransferase involved in cell wall biosynthesis